MSRKSGRLSVLAGSVVAGLLISLITTSVAPVLATPPAAGGSVIIKAAVAPVRYILVDDSNKIREILSNSPENVMPLVYKDKLNTAPVALSPAIYSQYKAIMEHVDARHAGTIYQAKVASNKKPAVIAGWLRLNNYARIASL